MLIDDGHIDPDVPNTEHIPEPQVRMIIEAMIEPAVELALHGMPLVPLEFVMIDPVIKAKRVLPVTEAFQVLSERRQDIVIIVLERRVILTEAETHFQFNFVVGEPFVWVLHSRVQRGDQCQGFPFHLPFDHREPVVEVLEILPLCER